MISRFWCVGLSFIRNCFERLLNPLHTGLLWLNADKYFPAAYKIVSLLLKKVSFSMISSSESSSAFIPSSAKFFFGHLFGGFVTTKKSYTLFRKIIISSKFLKCKRIFFKKLIKMQENKVKYKYATYTLLYVKLPSE